MSDIAGLDFMRFCVNLGWTFVLVDEDNKKITKDNFDEYAEKKKEEIK